MKAGRKLLPLLYSATCGAALSLGVGMALPIWESPTCLLFGEHAQETLWQAIDEVWHPPSSVFRPHIDLTGTAIVRTAGLLIVFGAGAGGAVYALYYVNCKHGTL